MRYNRSPHLIRCLHYDIVKWDIKGDYLIYGQDATLTCNGTSCPLKAIKKWLGGPNYNLLCFDDYSTKPTKYEMMSNDTRPEFDLMIKEFDFVDASCEYTCSCGFLQYTNMLQLDDSNFIYLPDVIEDSSNQSGDTFQIDLSMNVFPLPTCKLFYEDNVIPVSLTDIKGPTGNHSKFYTGIIQRTIDLKSYTCKGNASLTCQVQSLKRRLLHQHIDFCKAEDGHHEHGAKYVSEIVLSGFLILSAVIAFIIFKCVKQKRCTSESENPTESISDEMVSSKDEVEQTSLLNIPLCMTEANLPSNENPISNAYKENDNVKYNNSSIAKRTPINEYENG